MLSGEFVTLLSWIPDKYFCTEKKNLTMDWDVGHVAVLYGLSCWLKKLIYIHYIQDHNTVKRFDYTLYYDLHILH